MSVHHKFVVCVLFFTTLNKSKGFSSYFWYVVHDDMTERLIEQ